MVACPHCSACLYSLGLSKGYKVLCLRCGFEDWLWMPALEIEVAIGVDLYDGRVRYY